MRVKFSMSRSLMARLLLALGIAIAGQSYAEKQHIYSGYYSREGNNGKMAQTSGNNQYLKFYPQNRIIRLYIPFPYAQSVKPEAINQVFGKAVKASTGSAYIRDKFNVMTEPVVVHLDFFRWVDGQVMYDCSKPKPCKVIFDDGSMTVVKPGMVLEHKIRYKLVKEK